jgi:Asp/Glu/hydantoin racemase
MYSGLSDLSLIKKEVSKINKQIADQYKEINQKLDLLIALKRGYETRGTLIPDTTNNQKWINSMRRKSKRSHDNKSDAIVVSCFAESRVNPTHYKYE